MSRKRANNTLKHQSDPMANISPAGSTPSLPNVYQDFPHSVAVSPQETNNRSQFISLMQSQLSELLGSIGIRKQSNATFSSRTARFNGSRNITKVEDFLATFLIFKKAERILDPFALLSLSLLLEEYASTWWQGVKHEAKTFHCFKNLKRKGWGWRKYIQR